MEERRFSLPRGARSPAYAGYLEWIRPTADEGSSDDSSYRGGEGCIPSVVIRPMVSHAVNLEEDKDANITNFRLSGGGDLTEYDHNTLPFSFETWESLEAGSQGMIVGNRRKGGGWEDGDGIMVHLVMCVREERYGMTTAKGSDPSPEESMSTEPRRWK
jgi:hypothetical protein